LVTQSLQRSYP